MVGTITTTDSQRHIPLPHKERSVAYRLAKREYAKRYYWRNREEMLAASRAYRAKVGKRKVNAYVYEKRLREYGITWGEFDRLVIAQHGRCAICDTELTLPQVDHEHGGDVRGLLCAKCNKGLGNFLDSPAALRAAAAYLEYPPARDVLTPKHRPVQLHILDEESA
jgi:hypothetical protein